MNNHNIPLHFLAAAGLIAAAVTPALFAATYTDDFSTGLDPGYWTVTSNSALYSVDDSAGAVTISKPVGGTYTRQFARVDFRPTVQGDFDISIEFRDASIVRVDGTPGNQIQFNLNLGSQFITLVRSDEAGVGNTVHVYRDPPQAWAGSQSANATNGLLRFTRVGTQLSAYFNTNLIHQSNYNNQDLVLAFVLQNNGTKDATAVTFDNFSITAEAIILPPPTLSIVPLGAGSATVSWTPNTPGFVLQETLSLSLTNWMNSASGSTNPITVPVPGDMRYYRLFSP